jgi:hypothetical protein
MLAVSKGNQWQDFMKEVSLSVEGPEGNLRTLVRWRVPYELSHARKLTISE